MAVLGCFISAFLMAAICPYAAVAVTATGGIKGVVTATTQASGTRAILLSNARITLVHRDLRSQVMVTVSDDAGLGAALIDVVFFGANGLAQPQPAAVRNISIPASQANPSPTPQAQQPEPRAPRLRVAVTDARQHSLAGATCALIDSRR